MEPNAALTYLLLGGTNFFGQTVTKELIITLIGIGYAGTDFIEGFVKKAKPLSTNL